MKYFTADLHLGHEKAINFPDRKGFTLKSWEDMIIDLINGRLIKGDELYILGDFCVGKRKDLLRYRQRIKCRDTWLISGNHQPKDSDCESVFGKRFKVTMECKVKGAPTWLSHYPHLVWPKSHYGSFHLYGHLHFQREEYWNSIPELKERRSMDVCPEAHKAIFGEWGIFSEDQIYDLLSVKTNHDSVEWYREQRGEL